MKLQDNIKINIPNNFNEAFNLAKREELILCIRNNIIVPPYEVLIHPSSYCNLTCDWCIGDYVSAENTNELEEHYRPKSEKYILDNNINKPDTMLSIVNAIVNFRKHITSEVEGRKIDREFKVENVSFSGITGEPLVAKKAVKAAIDVLYKNDIRIGMFTNGLLIDPDDLECLTKLSYLNISLDAGNNETYNKLKCSSRVNQLHSFDKVMENIRSIIKYRDEVARKLEVNVSYIIYPENYTTIYEIACSLKALGVSNLRLKRDIYGKRLLNEEQKLTYHNQITDIKSKLVNDHFSLIEIHNIDDNSEQERDFSSCFIHHMMASIGSDGNMYPCNYHPKKNGFTIGNLLDTSFEDIWVSQKRKEISEKIPSICPKVCDPFKTRSNRLYGQLKSNRDFNSAVKQAKLIFKEKL